MQRAHQSLLARPVVRADCDSQVANRGPGELARSASRRRRPWRRLCRTRHGGPQLAARSDMTGASTPQGAVVYEVHEQVAGALLPAHDYAVTGDCATGTGTEPASLSASGGTGRGSAFGAGLGA